MKLHLRKRGQGRRYATYWVLESDSGQVVHRSAEEPFGFSTGARALTAWAADNGHEIIGGGISGEPRWGA